MKIGQIKSQKGFEALAEKLREQILNGTIPPGQVLNERELVEESGLSRGSVREAFRVLETQGLVSTRRGRHGGRVALQLDGNALKDSLELFIRGQQLPMSVLTETIEVFEPGLAELAARHRNDEDIAALTALLDTLERTSSPLRFIKVNLQWHQAVARASHNPILTLVYNVIGPELMTPNRAFVTRQIRADTQNAERLILDAIVEGDAEAARRRMEKHIRAYREQLKVWER